MPLRVLAPQLWVARRNAPSPCSASDPGLGLSQPLGTEDTFRLSLIRSPWDVELLFRGPRIPPPALLQGLIWGFVCVSSPQEVPVRLRSKELVTGGCACLLFP